MNPAAYCTVDYTRAATLDTIIIFLVYKLISFLPQRHDPSKCVFCFVLFYVGKPRNRNARRNPPPPPPPHINTHTYTHTHTYFYLDRRVRWRSTHFLGSLLAISSCRRAVVGRSVTLYCNLEKRRRGGGFSRRRFL